MTPAPTSQTVQQAILQTLYALFLGGILTALTVVGLTTFYPPPSEDSRLEVLAERESALYLSCGGDECSPAVEAQLREIQQERDEFYKGQQVDQQNWSRNAGIILITLATLLLALSLVRWDRAIVLSNGLLLGGLFSMVGGIGLTIAGGDGLARFLVLLVALALTVGLGYLRFARQGQARAAAPAAAGSTDDGELQQRVTDLEARLSEMRRALGG